MSESIIGDRLETERTAADPHDAGATNLHRRIPGVDLRYAPDQLQIEQPTDFMSDLLNAQQAFIAAQHACLFDSNMSALAAAQRDFIAAQGRVLERLRVFG